LDVIRQNRAVADAQVGLILRIHSRACIDDHAELIR
jgi:hypothetical protein